MACAHSVYCPLVEECDTATRDNSATRRNSDGGGEGTDRFKGSIWAGFGEAGAVRLELGLPEGGHRAGRKTFQVVETARSKSLQTVRCQGGLGKRIWVGGRGRAKGLQGAQEDVGT